MRSSSSKYLYASYTTYIFFNIFIKRIYQILLPIEDYKEQSIDKRECYFSNYFYNFNVIIHTNDKNKGFKFLFFFHVIQSDVFPLYGTVPKAGYTWQKVNKRIIDFANDSK